MFYFGAINHDLLLLFLNQFKNMKTTTVLLTLACIICMHTFSNAQNLDGSYLVNGYFFHPSASRPIATSKTIIQVGPNTYRIDVLGDLVGWGFQFTVDAGNHLTNWVATGVTPPAPASGFMTADNPGGIIYAGPPFPGTSPWMHATYNNTYNPATHTFYMHYGYGTGALDQNGYNRQVYEQYTLQLSSKISAVTPLSGTSLAEVTITGQNLSLVDPAAYSVAFGSVTADTAWLVSDNELHAKVAAGASGTVMIRDVNYHTDTFPGFVYTPVPPVTNPGWSYVGKPGFSQGKASYVSAATGTDNVPYVVFIDSASGRAKVMKFDNNNWGAVGPLASDRTSTHTDIVVTKANVPVVAFADSVAGVTVKAFNGNSWATLGNEGFAPVSPYAQNPYSMALDSNDVPYILLPGATYPSLITVFRLQGRTWVPVGDTGFAASGLGQAKLAIDKTTNTPYIVFDDVNTLNATSHYEATVMRFNGRKWVIAGNAGITNARNGIYYPDIQIDSKGNPFIAVQDDNGFERMSVYRFGAGAWSFVGAQRFSKSRSYYCNLTLDKKNVPYVMFKDASYNQQGTILKFSKGKGSWDTLGARGFLPVQDGIERHSLVFNNFNTPLVAFSDKNKGGKVSVVKFDGGEQQVSGQQSTSNNAIAVRSMEFSLYPNPAHNTLTVNLSKNETSSLLQVINLSGEVMIERKLNNDKANTITLDISKLAAGSYRLSVRTGNGNYSKQFIKN